MQLRDRQPKDYKTNVKLPRASKRKRNADDELYRIEVLEEKEERVKVHYIGWSEEYDEWRDRADIVLPPAPYVPYDPNRELAYRIKQALNSSTRQEPQTRIELPFDKLIFVGGLEKCGTCIHSRGGHAVYTIKKYSDLSFLLGDRWHMRGINDCLDLLY